MLSQQEATRVEELENENLSMRGQIDWLRNALADANQRELSHKIPTDQFVKVRKLPVVVHAIKCLDFTTIKTLEGDMGANPGDIIIRGVNGEKYPCKADIFNKTYEIVERDDD